MFLVWPGKIRSAAISLKGCNTKRRSTARGWGSVSSGVDRVSLPNAIKSKSKGRGSLSTDFGWRPNSFCSACSLTSSVSGVSPARGHRPTAAFTNGGEPGGQSTGEVCHSEDLSTGFADNSANRSIASRRMFCESPRFDPRAINTNVAAEAGRLIFCDWMSRDLSRVATSYFNPNTSCMSYRPGFCLTTHAAARRAPLAKVSRLEALWVSSKRSPFVAKRTV